MKFKYLKHLLLIGFIALTTTSYSQFIGKIPKNIRLIAGNYVNQSPYFSTLEAALNNVKAYTAVDNPYTFWLNSDTLFISDWATMKDSINDYYVATGLIKWAGFGYIGVTTYSDTSLIRYYAELYGADSTLESAYFSTPEQYSGTDAQKIDSAITNRGNKIVYLQGNYTISSRVSWDGNYTENLKIEGLPGSSITFTDDNDTFNWDNDSTGYITFKNFNKVKIHGVRFVFKNPTFTEEQDNGLVIKNCTEVDLQYNDITKASYAGLYLVKIPYLILQHNTVDSCLFANVLIREIGSDSTNSDISFNTFESAGYLQVSPTYYPFGYGLALATMWNSDSTKGNRNISIHHNVITESFRTAISGHNGINVTYKSNFIYRFGMSAISPINETGAPGYESFNQNIVIDDNTILFDSAWCARNNLGSNASYPIRPIWAGAYDDSVNAKSPGNNNPLHFPTGNVIVTDNRLYNMSMSGSYFYAPIIINVNRDYWYDGNGDYTRPLGGTSKIANAIVKNNTIIGCYSSLYTSGIVVTGTDYVRRDNPENINISGNNINGTGPLSIYGIQVSDGKIVNISNNNITGFTYGLLSSVPYSGSNNKIDSTVIADTKPLRNYMDYFKRSGTGMWNFNMEEGDSIKLKLATVNLTASQNGYGGQVFNINIYASSYFPDYLSKFEGIVSAGYGTDYEHLIVADSMKRVYPENYRSGNVTGITKPYLTWKASVEGGDSLYTLYAVLTHNYANYFIEANFNGATPVFMEDVVDTTTTVILGKVGAIGDVTTWFNRTYDTPFLNADSIYANLLKTVSLEANGSVKTMQLYATPIQLSDQTPTTADCDSSNTFYVILSEDLQIDLDNIMSGQIINIWITNDATPWVVTWTQTIKWLGGVAPVISTSSTDCITIELVGSTYYGAYSQNYATP